jgi:hypothetical protein
MLCFSPLHKSRLIKHPGMARSGMQQAYNRMHVIHKCTIHHKSEIFFEDSSLLGCDAEWMSEWFPMLHRPVMLSTSGISSRAVFCLIRLLASTSKILATTNTLLYLAADKENNTQTKTKQPMHQSVKQNEPQEGSKHKTKRHSKIITAEPKTPTHSNPENNTTEYNQTTMMYP